MKTHELFEEQNVRMMIIARIGEIFTAEYADHIINDAVKQAGGELNIDPSYRAIPNPIGDMIYYPTFPSSKAVQQVMKIFRRRARGKPRFDVTPVGKYEVHLKDLNEWRIAEV